MDALSTLEVNEIRRANHLLLIYSPIGFTSNYVHSEPKLEVNGGYAKQPTFTFCLLTLVVNYNLLSTLEINKIQCANSRFAYLFVGFTSNCVQRG